MPKPHRKKTPTESIAKLKARLAEAEETLRAICEGEVDAVVVSGPRGEQVYSLAGAESIYRLIVDTMKEAAFTLAFDGTILYSNARFGEFVRKPLDQIVGHRLAEFVRADEQEAVKKFLERGRRQPLRQRLVFTASDSAHVSAHISSNLMDAPHGPSICVVATDLTELENSTELIAKLREQQAALAESEGRYETLVAHAPDAIVVHQDERIVYANTAALRLYGAASFADLRERNIIDLVDQNDRGAVRIRAHLVQGGRTTPLRESRILRLDGQAVPVEATAGTIEYQGKPAVQVILRDISERKRAEEALRASESRFRVLAEAMPQIVWSADATGAVDYLNPQAFQFAGVRMEDAAGWNWRSFVHPDDLAHTEAGWRRTLATGEEDQIEHRLRRADGEYRWHLTRGGPVRNEKGKVIRWIGTATDIHDQKMVEQTLERLVAERTAELAHSKAQLETVTANAPIILFATDAQGVFTVHTGKAIAATGRRPGDLVGKHYLSFLPEWPEAVECIRRALAGESFTTVLAVPTGSTFEALYTPLLDTEGKSAGMIAVAVDVTERAKAESALRETQALTNAIVDSTTDLIWSVDPEHFGLMTFNVGLRNHFLRLGVRLQEGMRPEDCFADPALAAHWRGIYQRALKEGTFTLDYESATAGYMVVTANLLRRDGKVFGISVFGKDITERKRAQEALEKERHRLYDVLETLPAMICLLTADYHVAFANRAFRERFGESKGRRCYENCFGRSAPCEFCESYEVFKTNRPHHWEVRSPDGSVIDAYDYPFTDVDGTPMILEMDIDITARKRMEEQLHRLNRALRTLSAANEVVVRAGNELEMVQGVCKILAEVGGYRFVWVGYPQPDTAKSVRPVAYAGAGEAYLQGVKITWADDAWGRGPTGTAIRTGQPAINRHTEENATVSPWREEQSRHGFACSIALPLQAGSQVFGALSLYAAEPDAFNEDEVKLLTELAADLSFGIDAIRTRAAREGAAEALQESETRYKNFISHSIEGVWRVELANPLPLGLPESESLEWLLHHGIMAECNAAFARIAGFTSPDELVGRRMAEVIFPWDEGRMEAFRSMVHEGFQSRSVEIRTLDSESRRRDLVRTEIPIVENGRLVRVWGITRDVTDLKRAEAAVQKAFAEIRDLYNNAPCGYHSLDTYGVILRMNETELRWLGYTAGEVIGKLNFADLLTEDGRRRFAENFPRFKQSGLARDLEFDVVRKDGSVVPVLMSATSVRDEQGEYLMSRSTVYDMTDRKRALGAIAAERERLNDVLESLPVYVVLLTADYHVPFANRFFRERFGESQGRRCYEYLFGRSEPCEICETYTVFKTHQPHHWEWIGPDGRNYDIYDYPFTDTDGSRLILEMGIDITERKRAEASLRQLSAQLLRTQDDERRRIARELHDSIGQEFAALNLNLGWIRQSVGSRDPRTDGVLAETFEIVQRCTQQIRDFSYLLHPPMLDEYGLASALRWHTEGFARRTGIQVKLDLPENLPRLPLDLETALFRVVQECLTNVHRHAGSPTASIRLRREDGVLNLEVADQGRGLLLPASAGDTPARPGTGLAGMRERIRELGGTLEIESISQGTTVRVRLMLEGENAA